MRRLFGALFAVGCVLGFAPAADSPAPSVESLIGQLGDTSFVRREAASRELAHLGHAALPALEKAIATSTDPEVRHRANVLAAGLRRTVDASKHLVAKTVKLDYYRVPLGTAVSDLKAKTGVPLTLDQTRVADPLRIITAKSGDLPAWEAIEAFLVAAELKEVFRHDLSPPGSAANSRFRNQRNVYYEGGPPTTESASQVPVLLADGKATIPGDRSTSVRVLALPPNFPGNKVIRGAGTVVINLDVTPLGGLKWDDTNTVRIHKAEDETGRPITVSHRIETRPFTGYYGEEMFLGGQMAWVGGWDGEMYPVNPNARPNPRVIPITLKTDDRSITTLKVLEGAVVGEITLTNQTLGTFANLPKASGRTIQTGDMSITVSEHKVQPNGRVLMKVRVESPNQWAMQRLGGRRLGGRSGPTDGGGVAVANGGTILRFADGDGKALGSPVLRITNNFDDGITQTWDYDLDFAKNPNYGVPVTMTVIGSKTMTVDVPFRIKNVVLP